MLYKAQAFTQIRSGRHCFLLTIRVTVDMCEFLSYLLKIRDRSRLRRSLVVFWHREYRRERCKCVIERETMYRSKCFHSRELP